MGYQAGLAAGLLGPGDGGAGNLAADLARAEGLLETACAAADPLGCASLAQLHALAGDADAAEAAMRSIVAESAEAVETMRESPEPPPHL